MVGHDTGESRRWRRPARRSDASLQWLRGLRSFAGSTCVWLVASGRTLSLDDGQGSVQEDTRHVSCTPSAIHGEHRLFVRLGKHVGTVRARLRRGERKTPYLRVRGRQVHAVQAILAQRGDLVSERRRGHHDAAGNPHIAAS